MDKTKRFVSLILIALSLITLVGFYEFWEWLAALRFFILFVANLAVATFLESRGVAFKKRILAMVVISIIIVAIF